MLQGQQIASIRVSIADATLASPQHCIRSRLQRYHQVSIADATLASPQPQFTDEVQYYAEVSIADATLASPQPHTNYQHQTGHRWFQSQTRRLLPRNLHRLLLSNNLQNVSIADATLASPQPQISELIKQTQDAFQSQTRRLLPRNFINKRGFRFFCRVSIADATLSSPPHCHHQGRDARPTGVSIADATLASPQHGKCFTVKGVDVRFNRRRDACFPATGCYPLGVARPVSFNRRRDACFPATANLANPSGLPYLFQSQTRRLLPRNVSSLHYGASQR